MIDFGGDLSATGVQKQIPGSNMTNKPQTQNILNSTGPIKIQNRQHDGSAPVTDGKLSLNNTINFGREGGVPEKNNQPSGKFNDSINISDASIQEATLIGGHQKAKSVGQAIRIGNPSGPITKVKRQLNVISTNGSAQTALISGNSTGQK